MKMALINGTATSQTTFIFLREKWQNFGESGTYYFSSNYFTNLAYALYYSNGSLGFWKRNNGTFELNETLEMMRFQITINEGATFNNEIIKFQIEKGSSGTNWEKYTGETPAPNFDFPMDVKVVTGNQSIKFKGKNILPNSKDFRQITGYSGFSTLAEETYKDCVVRYYNGTNDQKYTDFSQWSNIRQYFDTDFKPGDIFTFSFWAKGKLKSPVACYFYGTEGYAKAKVIATNGVTIISQTNYNDGSCDFSNITSEWQRYYVTWEINPDATDEEIAIDKRILIRSFEGNELYVCGCMFERGQTTGEYKEYKLPQTFVLPLNSLEFCAIENYKDTLFKNTKKSNFYDENLEYGKWYKYEEISKFVFNGSEFWELTDENNLFICRNFQDQYLVQNALSNYFVNVVSADITDNKSAGNILKNNQFSFRNGIKDRLYLKCDKFSSAQDLKNWFTNQNALLYFVLKSPVRKKIKDIDLINILEKIENQVLMEDYCSVTITNDNDDNLPITIEIEAFKKILEN